jgi:thymidylate synthase
MSNNIDKQYQQLLKDIIEYGVEKQDRTGTGCKSIFGYTIRHNMKDGFPLLTTKKMAWKTMVTELLWFLRGDTNIKYLVDNNCHIWDGDAYKNYLNVVTFEKPDYFHEKHGHLKMSVKKEGDNYLPLTQEEFINRIKTDDKFTHWGDLGPIYGKQWRNWGRVTYNDEHRGGFYNPIDQIQNLISELKTNPDSRRLMVNAWNVGELDQMVLPPCHNLFQMYSVEKKGKRHLSIMVNIRSNDVPLGLPFNIASYALLLEIIAKIVDMIPEDLIINIGDAHIYLNQMEGVQEQLTREPFELPTLKIEKTDEFWNGFDVSMFTHLDVNDFTIENYKSHPPIKLPLSN